MVEALSPDRQRAAELIRKLKAITVEAGATEAEAMNAAVMARRLADQHALSLEAGVPVCEVRVDSGRIRFRPIDELWSGIASYCHVALLFLEEERMYVTYIGREADVLMAEWLHVLLRRHIEQALAAFKTQREYKRRLPHRRRVAAAAFVEAMVGTLRARLFAMSDRAAARPKIAEARTWIGQRYGELEEVSFPTVKDGRAESARAAGRQAGRDVAIATPMPAPPRATALLERK